MKGLGSSLDKGLCPHSNVSTRQEATLEKTARPAGTAQLNHPPRPRILENYRFGEVFRQADMVCIMESRQYKRRYDTQSR